MERLEAGLRHIPLQDILLPEPVVAGMNVLVIASLAYVFRSSNEDVEPITVRWSKKHKCWRVVDGRHRLVASHIAGRKTVLAVLES